MQKISSFIKAEAVLIISFLLALISSFAVLPDKEYISYIDTRTIALLFCLMAVVSGINSMGVFSFLAKKLLSKMRSVRAAGASLIMLCFFSSMLITNDVALITLVPFSIVTLKLIKREELLIPLISLETVAANLGSMATPFGNPQNLYLFSAFEMPALDFLSAVGPYSVLSLVILIIFTFTFPGDKIDFSERSESGIKAVPLIFYLVLLVISLLAILRFIPYQAAFFITLPGVAICDRKIISKVDYSLLLTFIFLFIFIGNLGRIEAVSGFLQSWVSGNETIVGIISSQVFSNVPAALLLSGFTQNAKALVTGVNLGGLGTLIASMASLISFKFIAKEKVNTVKYILVFTLHNIIFLSANLVLWFFL